MNADSLEISSASSWFLVLATTLTFLVAIFAFYATQKRESSNKSSEVLQTVFDSPGELEDSLKSAEIMNAYSAVLGQEPDVRLGKVMRHSPREYQAAVNEISMQFRGGKVISIDLGKMSPRQAARLVDFCSGMAVVSRGWIYRVTDQVIMLAPPDQRFDIGGSL
ncbi:cell division protein SepF [Nocardiopsis sp. YSL2]|uniref:cell division protein SepF n=1 Tax=Nocardiopsis sp. YSL2 TaxID=2939492 RepID=UPI0026F4366B|nr:cell division protein SepF [Nocardiopsis sp. YSL2]